jgi:hypothetical protein
MTPKERGGVAFLISAMLVLSGCAGSNIITFSDGRQLYPDFWDNRCIEAVNGIDVAEWPASHGNGGVTYCDLRDSPRTRR